MTAEVASIIATRPTGHGMDHPPSPLGAPMGPGHDGHNPTSPADHHPRIGHHQHHEPGMGGYRPPPGSSYGAPPPNYPPYSSYGPPQSGPYGSPPGYPSHGGPPGSYPPPPHHSSYGGYGGYPPHGRPTPYGSGYGYEGGYGASQARKGPPYGRGGTVVPPRQTSPTPRSQPTRHPSPPKGASPTSVDGQTSPQRMDASRPPKISTDHSEVERLRAAAATEISHAEVKPIRTDFHFFVDDNKEKFLKLAEEEVRKSTKAVEGEKLDVFLVNTNLNTRLMKAWEEMPKDERDAYMGREEDDRRRFMEEDEIASRHCATLTARGKSPRSPEKQLSPKKEEERQESETNPATTPDRDAPTVKEESVSPKQEDEADKTDDKPDDGKEIDKEEPKEVEAKKEDGGAVDESKSSPQKKRESPTPADTSATGEDKEEPTHESPPKRNRVDNGEEEV